MIIPIGHDREIFHFPYVTVTLIGLCLLVQVYSSFVAPPVDPHETMSQLRQESLVRARIWAKHAESYLRQHPLPAGPQPKTAREMIAQMRRLKVVQRQFWADFEAGRIVPTTDPDFIALQETKRERDESAGVLGFGYRPGGRLHTLVTYAFIHGGWLHLIGNMIFLWLCGCNLEDRWGRVVWLLVYLGGACASALFWSRLNPRAAMPLVGASGAIAAGMGAFLVVHGGAQIRMLYILVYTRLLVGTFTMRAYWALPFWFVQQALGMWTEGYTAVAYSAHVGGFAVGLVVALLMKVSGGDRRLHAASEAKATIFSQHPLYLEALTQLERGDRATAEATLERVLREQPDHVDAALELFRLSLDKGALPAARAASRALALCKRAGDLPSAQALYVELRARQPEAPLDDRSLFFLAQAFEKKDPTVAAAIYEQLYSLHPDSSIAPKAMLSCAQLHRQKLSASDRSQQILSLVLERYPGTPFAEVAAELLRGQAAFRG